MPTFSSRPPRIVAVAVGAVLAALVTAGCHDDTPPTTTVVTPPASTVVTPNGATAPGGTATTPDTKINTNAGAGTSTGTDTALAQQVKTAIVQNNQMTGARVEPVASAGIVTLNGQVQNQQQKALAEKSATQVPGVSGVKNKLIIVTTGGVKPKPTVITKTVIVHDKAAPASSDGGTSDTSAPAPTPAPDASGTPAPPAAPDAGAGSNGAGSNGANGGSSNP